jgi:hypothetical protein
LLHVHATEEDGVRRLRLLWSVADLHRFGRSGTTGPSAGSFTVRRKMGGPDEGEVGAVYGMANKGSTHSQIRPLT